MFLMISTAMKTLELGHTEIRPHNLFVGSTGRSDNLRVWRTFETKIDSLLRLQMAYDYQRQCVLTIGLYRQTETVFKNNSRCFAALPPRKVENRRVYFGTKRRR
jgi:hypothetical protein